MKQMTFKPSVTDGETEDSDCTGVMCSEMNHKDRTKNAKALHRCCRALRTQCHAV